MAYFLSKWLKPRFFTSGTNLPLAGGLLYTYLTGTTTNATTYSTSTGTANANPIVLDADGQCDLYLDDTVSYRMILKNSEGVTQFDIDPIASNDQGAIATAQAAIATAAANAADISESYASASAVYAATQATNAAASATTATTQATTATTQATNALASATASASSATAAAASETAAATSQSNCQGYYNLSYAAQLAAELARDQALANNRLYSSTANGLAATTTGQYFGVVQSGNSLYDMYLNNAGSAVYQNTYPSKAALDTALISASQAYERVLTMQGGGYITDQNIGNTGTLVTGSAATAMTYMLNYTVTNAGRLVTFSCFGTTAGTIKLKVFTRSGNTFTMRTESTVTIQTGSGVYYAGKDFTGFDLVAGDYIAMYEGAGRISYTSGSNSLTNYYSVTGDLTTSGTIGSGGFSASPITNVLLQLNFVAAGRATSMSSVAANTTAIAKAVNQFSAFETSQTITVGVATPATGSGGIGATASYFHTQRVLDAATLDTLSVYTSSAGNFKLKIISLNETTGAFDVTTDVTIAATAVGGTNTYTVSGGTLTPYYIPKNSMIGICSLSGGAGLRFDSSASTGNYNVSSDISGSSVAVGTKSYTGAPQFNATMLCQFTDRKTIHQPTRNYLLNETFASGVLPAGFVNIGSTWTFTGGNAVSGTAGFAKGLEYARHTNGSVITCRWGWTPTSADNQQLFGKRPASAGGSADDGTLFMLDVATNSITTYATWTGAQVTLPTVYSTRTLSGITLTNGRAYRVELFKSYKNITYKVTDMVTGVSDSVLVDQSAVNVNLVGYANGCIWTTNYLGSSTINDEQMFSPIQNPRTLIIGDSQSEVTGCSTTDSWTYQVAQAATDGVIIGADAGTTTQTILRRFQDEVSLWRSIKRVIIMCGRNDATSGASGLTAYQTYIPLIVALAQNQGLEIIVVHQMPTSSSGVQTYIDSMNSWIRSQGYRTVRVDLAMSVGNDGSTWDTSKMYDSSHPNAAGSTAIYNRMRLDVPELFE